MSAVPPHLFFISVPLYLPFSVPAPTRPPCPPHAAKSFCSITVEVAFVFRSLCLFICARGSRIPDCSPLCTRELFSSVLMSPCLTPSFFFSLSEVLSPRFYRMRSQICLSWGSEVLRRVSKHTTACYRVTWNAKWNVSWVCGREPKESNCKGAGLPKETESLLHKPSVSYTQNRPISFLHCHLSVLVTAQAATLDASRGEQKCTTVYDLTFASQK